MSGQRRLIITAEGDPRNAATWSGTPRNIIDGLEAKGWEVTAVDMSRREIFAPALYGAFARPFLGRGTRAFRNYYGPSSALARHRAGRVVRGSQSGLILHTNHWWLPATRNGARNFLFRDTPWREFAESQGLNPRLTSAVEEREIRALAQCEHIFTTSNWCSMRYQDLGVPKSKISTVGTGTGIDARSNPHASKDYNNGHTIFIARSRLENKGLGLLIEGFKLARDQRPRLTLTVVAPPEFHQEVAGVTFLNDVSATELNQLFAKASLFAMPATFEPWGLVYLEAQSRAVPTLGLRSCAYPELIGNGAAGFIVDQPTPSGVANTLVIAHDDPKRLAAMGSQGYLNAPTFSWTTTCDRISSVLEAL